MVEPCVGFVAREPRPVVPVFLIHNQTSGGYAERNPALQTWRFTALRQYATRFATRAEAEAAIPAVLADCGDVYHVSAHDVQILERDTP